jgi:hypothetical protein
VSVITVLRCFKAAESEDQRTKKHRLTKRFHCVPGTPGFSALIQPRNSYVFCLKKTCITISDSRPVFPTPSPPCFTLPSCCWDYSLPWQRFLLFERPIKIADVIEVSGNVGEVRRIGIRASVIRTSDGSEVIVPNGSLISSQERRRDGPQAVVNRTAWEVALKSFSKVLVHVRGIHAS